MREGATQADRVLAVCIGSYSQMIFMMDEGGMIFTEYQALAFKNLVLRHLQAYSWLHSFGMQQRFPRRTPGRRMFQLLPKCHHLWHLAHDTYQSRLNPKLSQLMSAESFIGVIGRIGRACHRSTVQSRAIQRYLARVKVKIDSLT